MGRRPRHIVWTEQARRWPDEILEYVAEDSPRAASELVLLFLGAAESLSTMSHRGRVVPEHGEESIREIIVKRYRLI